LVKGYDFGYYGNCKKMSNSVQINVEDAIAILLSGVSGLNIYKTNRIGAKLFPSATISASVTGQVLGNYTGVYEVNVSIDYSDTSAKKTQANFDAEYCSNFESFYSQTTPLFTKIQNNITDTKVYTARITGQTPTIKTAKRAWQRGLRISIICTPYIISTSVILDALIVAGGGGGGGASDSLGGGGGGGGFRVFTGLSLNNGIYSVIVGGGGSGGFGSSGLGENGGDSTFNNYTSIGGGGGGALNQAGLLGGSGGGGGQSNTDPTYGGDEVTGQGNYGGFGGEGGTNTSAGGGGGGAGSIGQNAQVKFSQSGGDGGSGLANSFSGTSVIYSGGGGGGGYGDGSGDPFAGGNGGTGGGGIGSDYASGGGTNGLTNTGGGGGGAGSSNGTYGGNGGSGIVIIRYLTSAYGTRGSGGTITTIGGYTIHTFTSSGNFTIS